MPAGSADSDFDYHFYGDVFLAGASKDGTTLTVTDADGTVLVDVAYGHSVDTAVGKAQVKDQEGPDGVYDDRVHYWFEVTAGTFTVTLSNGNFRASTTATASSTESYELEHGTYYIQQVEDLTLEETAAPDADADGVADASDNCVDTANPDQADTDADGTGDACTEAADATEEGTPTGNATVEDDADATGNETVDNSTPSEGDADGTHDTDAAGDDGTTDADSGDVTDAPANEDAAADDAGDDAHDAGTQGEASTKTPAAGALAAFAVLGALALALGRRNA